MKQSKLVEYLDGYLRLSEFQDRSLNGLQVQGPDELYRISFAVDFCGETSTAAAKAEADWLIVHHGWIWGEPTRLTGVQFAWIRSLIQSGVGLYAAHLPLDAHPEVGNNIVLARLLGLKKTEPFGQARGMTLGFRGTLSKPQTLEQIAARLGTKLDTECRFFPFGPRQIRTVGIVSGAAASMIPDAIATGLDLFVTGESSHTQYHVARDAGINVIFAGHYATETVGLKALAAHLENRFKIETHWIECPTGL